VKHLNLLLISLFITNPLFAANGEENYKAYCWQCHGMQGDGMGINIENMSVQPRDHTDKKSMSARSDAELFKVIKEGGLSIDKSVLMPPWADVMSDAEIKAIVQYLRKLCDCG